MLIHISLRKLLFKYSIQQQQQQQYHYHHHNHYHHQQQHIDNKILPEIFTYSITRHGFSSFLRLLFAVMYVFFICSFSTVSIHHMGNIIIQYYDMLFARQHKLYNKDVIVAIYVLLAIFSYLYYHFLCSLLFYIIIRFF